MSDKSGALVVVVSGVLGGEDKYKPPEKVGRNTSISLQNVYTYVLSTLK